MWFSHVKKCIILVFLLSYVLSTEAQIGQNYFIGDLTNIYDYRSIILNPSIGSFQRGAIEIGYKIFYLGFIKSDKMAFKSGYAIFNFPRRFPLRITFNFHSQFFSTPIYQDMNFKIALSRPFWSIFSIGFSAGFRNFSYNTDNFQLEDPDDPVFSKGTSLWQPDVGAGITIIPISNVIVGVGIDHINRPRISLLDNTLRLEPRIRAGISVNFAGLSFLSSGDKTEKRLQPQGTIQFYNENLGMLQAGFQENLMWARFRLNVVGALAFGYGFGYPIGELNGTTNGTHETFLIYEFDRIRKIPEMEPLPRFWIPFVPQMPRVDIVQEYYPMADVESVDIYEKNLIREIDPDINAENLKKLSIYDFGVLDTNFAENPFPYKLKPIAQLDTILQFRGKYSKVYLKSLKNLRRDLIENPTPIYLITPFRSQLGRAYEIGSFLGEKIPSVRKKIGIFQTEESTPETIRVDSFTDLKEMEKKNRLIITKPRWVNFKIYSITKNNKLPKSISVVIENANGEIVRRVTPQSDTTDFVRWNWYDKNGRIIAAGFYNYYVEWIDQLGSVKRSPSRVIYARKLKRNIYVKVSKEYIQPDGKASRIGIILNK